MIIQGISSIGTAPKPELGLLPAIHDAEVEATVFDDAGNAVIPTALAAKGRVFINQGVGTIVIPAYQNWPAREVSSGEVYGSDGRLYYKLYHKTGTTSYYPQSFERVVYSFAFTGRTFPAGSDFEFKRNVFMRLISNNTTALWSVIFEIGEKVAQVDPKIDLQLPALLTEGSKVIQVTDPQGSKIAYNMLVSGAGVEDGTRVYAVSGDSITLTRAVGLSGEKLLTFKAPIGPNIFEWKWLAPLIDENIILTDARSQNLFGIYLKNWGSIYKILPYGGGTVVDYNRSSTGMEGICNIFGALRNASPESLPSTNEFMLRMRIGQFDVENNVADPRGYAAYLVVDSSVDPNKV